MINLLSDAKKREIRAGRTNVVIMKYFILTAAGVGLLFLLLIGTYFALDQTRRNAQDRVAQSEEASAAYSDTQQAAQEFRNNLATAKQIMDKEVTYSKLILEIAQAIPSGVYLESLSLSAETIGAPLSLNARATSVDKALALKSSLENHPELFSNIYFENLIPRGGTGSYPVQATINVTINKEALS